MPDGPLAEKSAGIVEDCDARSSVVCVGTWNEGCGPVVANGRSTVAPSGCCAGRS